MGWQQKRTKMSDQSESCKTKHFSRKKKKKSVFFYFYLNLAELLTILCSFWMRTILASEDYMVANMAPIFKKILGKMLIASTISILKNLNSFR